ncbi:hypothetical protein ACB098_07G092300 [Castanea mollissima]
MPSRRVLFLVLSLTALLLFLSSLSLTFPNPIENEDPFSLQEMRNKIKPDINDWPIDEEEEEDDDDNNNDQFDYYNNRYAVPDEWK